MGNFSNKEGHGPSGPHLDLFHTPPTSPLTPTLPGGAAQLLSSCPPQSSTPRGKAGPAHAETPTNPTAPDWKCSPIASQEWSVIGSDVSQSPNKAGSDAGSRRSPRCSDGSASSASAHPPPSGRISPPASPPLSPSGRTSPPASPPLSPSGRTSPPASPPLSPSGRTSPPASPPLSPSGRTSSPPACPPLSPSGRTSPPASPPLSPSGRTSSPPVSPPLSPSGRTSSPPASPLASLSERSWQDKDSALEQSLVEGHGATATPSVEERLLEECRGALGLGLPPDTPHTLAGLLKHFLTERGEMVEELRSLKEAMQAERGEWLQFQADLQVAVGVADRLRAEAEEELSTLREERRDWERQLADAQRGRREAKGQLEILKVELEESRQRPAPQDQSQGPDVRDHQSQGPDTKGHQSQGPDTGGHQEGPLSARGRERGGGKGVVEGYLRSVAIEERRRGEGERGVREPRRAAATERSRSLSRLPLSSDTPSVMNGTSQATVATTMGSVSKSTNHGRGRKSLDPQDCMTNIHTGKQEKSAPLHQSNCALTDLPSTKASKTNRPQEDFSRLLRRHGGSKRNSLLRWCQSRTQGYKNIEITNFSSSWADGLAFCAVYHTYLPSHIPYCSLSLDRKRENLTLAFQTGESVGITASLTTDEMLRAGGPDWQRVLGYVESMYRHFEM